MGKSFRFASYINAQEVDVTSDWITYRGNILLEIVLPNALKFNSFRKLDKKLYDFYKSHGGKYPERIVVNRRQYMEYRILLQGHIYGYEYPKLIYKGVPIIIREK